MTRWFRTAYIILFVTVVAIAFVVMSGRWEFVLHNNLKDEKSHRVSVSVNEIYATQPAYGHDNIVGQIQREIKDCLTSKDCSVPQIIDKFTGVRETLPGFKIKIPNGRQGYKIHYHIYDKHHRTAIVAMVENTRALAEGGPSLGVILDALTKEVKPVFLKKLREIRTALMNQAHHDIKLKVKIDKILDASNPKAFQKDVLEMAAPNERNQRQRKLYLSKETIQKCRALPMNCVEALMSYKKVANLPNDKMRSAMGDLFYLAGINADDFENFIQFEIGDRIRNNLKEKYSISLANDIDFGDPRIRRLLMEELLDKEMIQYLRLSECHICRSEKLKNLKNDTRAFNPNSTVSEKSVAMARTKIRPYGSTDELVRQMGNGRDIASGKRVGQIMKLFQETCVCKPNCAK